MTGRVGATLLVGIAATTAAAFAGSPEQKAEAAKPRPPAASADAALSAEYALKPGEVLRVIDPPFSNARAAWANLHHPGAGGSDNIRSLGFGWDGEQARPTYMSYVDQTLDGVADTGLREPWYSVAGLDVVRWPAVHGDFVVRDGATAREKFDALAGLIRTRTGRAVRFVAEKRKRPCIVLTGDVRQPPESERGFPTLMLSQQPMDAETILKWGRGDRPESATHGFTVGQASVKLDAPFFRDVAGHGRDNSPQWLCIVAADAQLKHDDPDYKAKLRKVLDNVQAQVGGQWRIEDREIETFVLTPNEER